jgi:hypothetical protein
LATTTISALPTHVRILLAVALRDLCDGGLQALVSKGQFGAGDVDVAEERLREFGSTFVTPPEGAIAYVYQNENGIDVEVPLWIDGATEPSDLFAYFSIYPSDSRILLTDIRAP